MTGPAGERPGQEGPEDASVIETFVAQLTDEERMLIVLKSQLYESSGEADEPDRPDGAEAIGADDGWQGMLTDLNNRLEGKPYIFKLANRIADDIARIEKLRAFEEQHKVNLSDYVEPPMGRGPEGK